MAAEASTRSLADKLGVKGASSVALVNAPAGFVIGGLDPGVEVVSVASPGQLHDEQLVVVFVRATAEIAPALSTIAPVIFPDGAIWVAWPRRAGGHQSDVTDSTVRAGALELGLVDVKVAALDVDWSGLRLVWRRELRGNRVPRARGASRRRDAR